MPFFPRKSVKDSKMNLKIPSRSTYNYHVCASCHGSGNFSKPSSRPDNSNEADDAGEKGLGTSETCVARDKSNLEDSAYNTMEIIDNNKGSANGSLETSEYNDVSGGLGTSFGEKDGALENADASLEMDFEALRVSNAATQEDGCSKKKASSPNDDVGSISARTEQSNDSQATNDQSASVACCYLKQPRGKDSQAVAAKEQASCKEDEAVNARCKFHNPPKSIFAPTVEVSLM